MKDILHSVPIIHQEESSDCVQASAAQLLSFYGIQKTVSEVKSEVPVYIDASGKPLGTSIGHLASYFISLGFEATIHTSDIQLFDPTWNGLSSNELIEKLNVRKEYLKHATYDQEAINLVTEG